MSNPTRICIGIQARSTSNRFPRKVFENIGGRSMLSMVIDSCERSARYLNRHSDKSGLLTSVSVLVPEGDEIAKAYRGQVHILEGSEYDVLARYEDMAQQMEADYIVRITADCPLIPPFLITKHIKTAVMNQYDYVSNVDEAFRTSADGFDCEVISSKLLSHAAASAVEISDREHVTTLIRRDPPDWARMAHITGFLALHGMKLSVDTPEDLERVREVYESLRARRNQAERTYGKINCHQF